MTPSQQEAVLKCGRIETAFKQCTAELKRHGIRYVISAILGMGAMLSVDCYSSRVR